MEIKTVKKGASKVSNFVWIESLKSAKKMQHALRVAVSNKAGSGKSKRQLRTAHQHTSGGAVMYSTPPAVAVGLVGAPMPCSCRLPPVTSRPWRRALQGFNFPQRPQSTASVFVASKVLYWFVSDIIDSCWNHNMEVGNCFEWDKATSDSKQESSPYFQPESGGQSILSLI